MGFFRLILTDAQLGAAIAVSPFVALAMVGLALESMKIFETISDERAHNARVEVSDVAKWEQRQ